MSKLIVSLTLLLSSTLAFATTPPSSLSVVPNSSGVTLTWSASNSSSTVNYRVYRDDFELAKDINALQYTDSTVTAGGTFKYFVIACDANQLCGDATDSQTISYMGSGSTTTPVSCPVVSGSTNNNIPSNVQLSFVGQVLTLSWTPPTNSVKWNVYRNGDYEYTVFNGNPSYSVENHVQGNEYTVTAIYPDGAISGQSASATLNGSGGNGGSTTNCSQVQADNAQLQADNAAHLATIAQLQADNAALTSGNASVAQLQADNAALTAANSQLTSDNATLTSDNATLTSANSQLTSDNATLTSDNATLAAANTQLTADNAALTTANQQLAAGNQPVAQLQTDLANMTADRDARIIERDAALAANTTLANDNATLTSSNNALTSANNTLTSANVALLASNQQLTNDLATCQSDNNQLQSDINNANSNINSLTSSNTTLTNANTQLQSDLQACQAQLP